MRKVTLIAIAILAVASIAVAGQTQVAKGKIQAVSGNTLTVTGDDGEVWSFEATSQTTVIAEGAAHKSKKLSATGDAQGLSQFVREDQHVIVKFREDGDTRYIENLRVL
jgi:hypothetical protein